METRKVNFKRDGIALVVVLGFLSVLTLIAVSMAISMRMERLASESYLNMVKARFYCNAALSDSMVWLEDFLANTSQTNFVVAPCFKESADQGWSVWWWMLPSRDNVSRPVGEYDYFKSSFFDGIGTNFLPYVPIRYQYELPGNSNDLAKMGVQWIHITNNATRDVEGRYMYMIFDCSAFVDINYAAREIVPGFKLGGDWDMIADRSNFLCQRSKNVRYETERDVADSNSEVAQSKADWFHFSYSPPMKRVRCVKQDGINKVEFINDIQINGSNTSEAIMLPREPLAIKTKKGELLAAFDALIDVVESRSKSWVDFPGSASAKDLYELLIDFADKDLIPENKNFERPSIEPVPMVNEVMISSNIANVEVWCPFVGPGERRFSGSFEIRVNADGKSGKLENIRLPPWPSEVCPPDPIKFEVELAASVTNNSFDVEIAVGSKYSDLDKVTLKNIQAGRFSECDDPRFNHLESQWQKNSKNGSMNAVNNIAAYARNINDSKRLPAGDSYLLDGDCLMYCANRPLDCPGDLGYLPVAPWRTLKLYEDWGLLPCDGPTMDPVLDYFTMQSGVAYGKCNPNPGYHYGRSVDSILDSFNQSGGGYMGLYKDEPETYNEFLFKNFAQLGQKEESSHQFARNIVYTFSREGMPTINPSTFGSLIFRFNNQWVRDISDNKRLLKNYKIKSDSNRQYSELRLEHLMRRASQLANMRQNLFLICIWAQHLGKPTGGKTDWDTYPVKSEAQAVALIWRDPYPVSNQNQYHPKFVRFMRWME